MTTRNHIGALLNRVRDWWRRQEGLNALDDEAVGLVAADLGISANAIRDLVARGPKDANLLYERMRALGISKADVDHAANGVMRDLQRTCSCCNEKGVCDWDLAQRPDDPVWKGYCPNADALDFIRRLSARSSSPPRGRAYQIR